MLALLHRRSAARLSAITFCDSCAEVRTPVCRAERQRDRVRTQALHHASSIR